MIGLDSLRLNEHRLGSTAIESREGRLGVDRDYAATHAVRGRADEPADGGDDLGQVDDAPLSELRDQTRPTFLLISIRIRPGNS